MAGGTGEGDLTTAFLPVLSGNFAGTREGDKVKYGWVNMLMQDPTPPLS